VSRLILLDAGPLGLVTNPRESAEGRRCKAWLWATLDAGDRVMVPEGADYEVRRELLRVGRPRGIARLDELARLIGFLAIDTATWRRAAELWEQARRAGHPTAADAALDFDVLLAAQAQLATGDGLEVIVATTNAGHLGRFVDAREWSSLEG
jgi:hypothetical protein